MTPTPGIKISSNGKKIRQGTPEALAYRLIQGELPIRKDQASSFLRRSRTIQPLQGVPSTPAMLTYEQPLQQYCQTGHDQDRYDHGSQGQ